MQDSPWNRSVGSSMNWQVLRICDVLWQRMPAKSLWLLLFCAQVALSMPILAVPWCWPLTCYCPLLWKRPPDNDCVQGPGVILKRCGTGKQIRAFARLGRRFEGRGNKSDGVSQEEHRIEGVKWSASQARHAFACQYCVASKRRPCSALDYRFCADTYGILELSNFYFVAIWCLSCDLLINSEGNVQKKRKQLSPFMTT